MSTRMHSERRETAETAVSVTVSLDGSGEARVSSGLGFLDHMLAQLARHGRFDIELSCKGDLHIDDHHSVEDCAIVLGRAFAAAVGDKRGIRRFGHAYAPLDEALCRVVVDLSGRPWAEVHLPLRREKIGDVACESLLHFMRSFAIEAKMTLHVDLIRGENDHHKVEAAFKALAIALRAAVSRDGDALPSTKGAL